MMRVMPTPEGPHFIFDRKMWEIESCYIPTEDGRSISKIRFKHIVETAIIDEDEKFEMSKMGKALTINEAVDITIDDDFADPLIKMYVKNEGTLVSKEQYPKIEPLELPMFVIKKLVWEALKIDTKYRDEQDRKEKARGDALE